MKNRYLSDIDLDSLQKAYRHELRNSLIYREISSWLNVKGFVNLAKYYATWAEEEINHSQWVKEFLESLNVPVKAYPIDEINLELDSNLINFVKKTMEVEDSTTNLYDDLLQSANDYDSSLMLIQFCNKMLTEQIEETDKALTLNDKINNIGENTAFLQLFDNTFE